MRLRYEIGAGGGIRTHTPTEGQRILSPPCLPFHHPGNLSLILTAALIEAKTHISPDRPSTRGPICDVTGRLPSVIRRGIRPVGCMLDGYKRRLAEAPFALID